MQKNFDLTKIEFRKNKVQKKLNKKLTDFALL